VLLAAGGGRRMGRPKALVRHPAADTTLLEHAIGVLRAAGCGHVVAVLGAEAESARARAAGADVLVEVPDWRAGQSASLRAGLEAAAATSGDAAGVLLVDLPDVGPPVISRVLAAAGHRPRRALVRATFGGEPGHPVVLGRSHWDGVLATATGDRGARDYLATHDVKLVECGDLASGRDVDTPHDL